MEFLLTLILVIVLGGWLLRVILGTILRTWLMRKQKQFSQQFNTYQKANRPNRPEGDVTVEKTETTADTNRSVDKRVGEYVDFEEENK